METVNRTKVASIKKPKKVLKEMPYILKYWENIFHKWFSESSIVQDYVDYAYKKGWIRFVIMLECENWLRDIKRIGDHWRAFWLCQNNDRFRNVSQEFKDNRKVQIDTCYDLWKWWTRFYWPTRKDKKTWVMCKDTVVKNFKTY